jgi:hypothetical protein
MQACIFQIALDEPARHRRDSGFTALDDLGGYDAQAGEYGAIRQFLLTQATDDDTLYGFFAGDFHDRTGLTAQQVHAFLAGHPGCEAYTFAPAGRDDACYLNVFESADAARPGFLAFAQLCVERFGLEVDLATLAMDARSMVDGHYIVARKSFWITWLPLAEKLCEILDNRDPQLNAAYTGLSKQDAQDDIRCAMIGRLASLVLALCPDMDARAYDPYAMPWTDARQMPYEKQLAALDQIKTAYLRTGAQAQLESFYSLRDAVLRAVASVQRATAGARHAAAPAREPASSDVFFACFTHVPLPFEYPSFVTPIYLGDAQGEGKANLRDLAPEWEPYHPQLGSLAGCFALKNHIVKNKLNLRMIGMCQYRKFVSQEKIGGTPAPNYPVMDLIGPETLRRYDLAQIMLPRHGDDLLLSQYWAFQVTYLQQYNASHHVEDFLRFTSEAVELGVLDRKEVANFFAADVFMPGGIEIGVFPAAFWIDAMSAIERVVAACVKRYPTPREGYQLRSWAFCVERLGSYLLLKYLLQRYGQISQTAPYFGQINIYSTDTSGVYVGNGAHSVATSTT